MVMVWLTGSDMTREAAAAGSGTSGSCPKAMKFGAGAFSKWSRLNSW